MTTDPRSPSSRPNQSSDANSLQTAIDEWASRRLDGEVSAADVPDEIRAAVELRTRQFGDQQTLLRTTPAAVGRSRHRDAHIATALASMSSRRSTSRARFASARTLAIAASIVCFLAISAVALRSVGSRDDALIEAEAVATQDQSMDAQPAQEGAATETVDVGTAQAPVDSDASEGLGSNVLAATGSSNTPRTFASIEDIARAATERTSAVTTVEIGQCAEPTDRTHVVERAVLVDRDVEIHFFSDGTFSVYDFEDCSVVDVTETGR